MMTVSPHEQTAPLIMSAVVAMAANRVIGDGTGLIWHLPDDLKRVKALTMGCPLIMGRKTWDSIGRPLPGRGSIVLTRDQHWHAEGAIIVHDFNAALVAAKSWIAAHNPQCRKIILFGGGEIYRMGLDYCQQIDLTVIDISPDGGQNAALFPALDAIAMNAGSAPPRRAIYKHLHRKTIWHHSMTIFGAAFGWATSSCASNPAAIF